MNMMMFLIGPMVGLSMFAAQTGTGDGLEFVDPVVYWQIKNVEITADNMIAELNEADPNEPPAEKPPLVDYDAIVQQLGSDAFADREAAQKKLEEAGQQALPALEKGTESDDPEISVRSQRAIHNIQQAMQQQQMQGIRPPQPPGPQHKAIRRLMAIRTIGEKKYRQALPLLEQLTNSPTLFEAEYARRAIAQINDKPFELPQLDQRLLAADVAAMPANTLAIMQSRTARQPQKLDLRNLIFAFDAPADVYEQMMRGLISTLETTGNYRIDSITASLSFGQKIESDACVIVHVRGIWDLEAMPFVNGAEPQAKQTIAGVDVYGEENFKVAIISPSHAIAFVFADDAAPPIEDLIVAARDGKPGGIEKNQPMADLLKTIDQTKTSWGALMVTPEMRELPVLAAISSLTLEINNPGNSVEAVLKARGPDDDQVAQSGRLAEAAFQSILIALLQQMNQDKKFAADMGPVLAALKSVRFNNQPGLVTVTGKIEDMTAALGAIPTLSKRAMNNLP